MSEDIKDRLIGRIAPEDNYEIGVVTVRLPNKQDVWETALIVNNRMYVVATYRFKEDATQGHQYWIKHSRTDNYFFSKFPECTIDRNGNRVKLPRRLHPC